MSLAIDKAQYRRIRNFWGLALMVAWVAYWWVEADAAKRAALASITDCEGFINGTKCALASGNAEASFGGSIVVAILSAPLMLIASHYFARWRVEQEAQALRQREQSQAQAAQQADERNHRARMLAASDAAAGAKAAIDRGEFIQKLGAVSDFLDLLADETDANRRATIRLGATQALRDLVAKHPPEALAAIVDCDSAARTSLEATLGRLDAAGMGDSAEVRVLREAPARLIAQPSA